MKRVGSTTLGALLGLILTLLLAAGAQAQEQGQGHPELIGSDPVDGAVLDNSPASLALEFVDPVTPLVARLTSPSGQNVLLPPPLVAGNRLIYALPPGLSRGSHLLSWRVTSGEGHTLAGASLFSVGAPSVGPQPVAPWPWMLRGLALAALALGLPWLAGRTVPVVVLVGTGAILVLIWLLPFLVALHIAAILGWASSCLLPGSKRSRVVVRRWLLAAVIASGAALAAPLVADARSDQLGLVSAKLVLVAALVWLSTRRRSGVLAEARIVLLLLLICGSGLVHFVQPPAAQPFELQQKIAAGGISAVIEVLPAQTGLVWIRVADLRLDGVPVTAQSMVLELSKPAYGLGPFRVESGPDCGFFDAGRFLLPIDGYWVVKLSVQLDESRRDELTDLLEIAPSI